HCFFPANRIFSFIIAEIPPYPTPNFHQAMKYSLTHRRTRGFALIELLVVITIVALLVTGAFGAYGFVMDRAKRAEAQSMCMTFYTAIDEYNKDYDYLPEPMSATKD